MKTEYIGNLLVGYFALDGSFSPLVGIGLNQWGLQKNGHSN